MKIILWNVVITLVFSWIIISFSSLVELMRQDMCCIWQIYLHTEWMPSQGMLPSSVIYFILLISNKWFALDEVIVETKPKMEDNDRVKIRSNLSRLVLRTQWNEKLETCLLTKGVFKPKMIELIKVNPNIILWETPLWGPSRI